ncbi:MAG: hypothetical protein GPJ54_20465 [Candidatus Heimdallarchaeota archaeon]|nr:hypothetical protein [Candidatus Heimdallarchaeota archaeon]
MRKIGLLSIIFLTMLLMGQTSLAAVHLPPKAIKKAADLSYEVDTTGNTLIWQYEAEEGADLPGTYIVFMDNVALVEHDGVDWEDKVDIVVDVDGLAIGSYTFKIEITDHDTSDEAAITTSDEALVTVVAELATSSSTSTSSSPMGTTSTPESSTESDTNLLFVPFLAMLLAIGIGVPILKYKDFKQ